MISKTTRTVGTGAETHQRASDGLALTINHRVSVGDKAIGARDAAQSLLDKAEIVPDHGVTSLDDAFVPAAMQRLYAREPILRTLA